MKDALGRELEHGQKVVFSVGTDLRFGTLQRVRQKISKHARVNGRNIAVVKLDKPEAKFTQRRYVSHDYTTGITTYSGGERKGDRATREISQENRICILG